MAESKTGIFSEIIRPTLVLISVCVVVAGLLAVTYHGAGIQALESAGLSEKQLAESLPVVLPGGSELVRTEVTCENENLLDVYLDTGKAGAAVYVKSKGYGGTIKILVGFDKNGSVTGIRVIEHGETPGLGTRAFEQEYLAQYQGASQPTAIKADGGEIDAISGSTVSSRAVAAGVGDALRIYETVKGELQ